MKNGNEIKFWLQWIRSQAREKLRNQKILPAYDWKKINSVFIISTGRTGTHFFSHFFDSFFDDVYALHEPDTDIFDLNIQYLKNNISEEQARAMMLDFRRQQYSYLRDNNIPYYIESNNNLAYLIPVIRKAFKNYKIIHIARNGKDVVRSLFSKTTRGKWVGEVPIFSDEDPQNRIKATFFEDDPYSDKWNDMSRFERCCWAWAKKDALICEEIKNDPRARTVKFETLFKKKDLQAWMKLVSFTGIRKSMDPGRILTYLQQYKSNETRKFKLGKWEDWPEEKKDQFLEIAGEHMENLGYDL